MKDWLKKNYKIFFVLLLLIFGGPIVINILFKIKSPIWFLAAEWDASAALSYYGAIIAAFLAIYGIFITVQYSQKNYREDVRNRSLPFIVVDMLRSRSIGSIFPTMETIAQENAKDRPTEGYFEYKITDFYCILKNGKIEYRTGLTPDQQRLRDNCGREWVTSENENEREMKRHFCVCIPLEIENVGNGTAIRMRIGLNRKEILSKDRQYTQPQSMKPGVIFKFHIFSEDCSQNSENLGKYVLSFCYEDIYLNHYEQNFKLFIGFDKEKSRVFCSIDLSHVQKFLGGELNGKNENGIS